MLPVLRRLLKRTEGQDLIEYALLVALISLATMTAIAQLGGRVSHLYSTTVAAPTATWVLIQVAVTLAVTAIPPTATRVTATPLTRAIPETPQIPATRRPEIRILVGASGSPEGLRYRPVP